MENNLIIILISHGLWQRKPLLLGQNYYVKNGYESKGEHML
ncbi:MAG: hypothetical protein QXT39_04555 [Conexivisphaerales archaeon]